jgi:integrase
MPRVSSGTFDTRTLGDGTRAFRLRFNSQGRREIVTLHERRGCECGCGGGWQETAARTELGNILARVRAGVWERPTSVAARDTCEPGGASITFHEYASRWLQAKIDGVTGEKPIDANTQADYRWRLSCHLLPFFAAYPLSKIDRVLCLQFKAHKLREAQELREAIAAGADLRDERGRRRVPLGPSSLRKLIDTLAAILDDAIEDEHIDRNPARGKRMRVRVPKPNRSFLEMDELARLLDAAAAQDKPLAEAKPPAAFGTTTALVAHLLAQGYGSTQIAKRLGLAKSTVSYHVQRLQANAGRGYVGRRIVVEILARSGVRVSELCDLRIGEVRLHDPDGARFRIPDAKTETGIREVQMTPDLVEAVIEHLDRLRRIGAPTGSESYLVPNLRGGRLARQRAGEIIGEAAAAAREQTRDAGLPPLPHITPHSLRRTYISIALLANNFDVKWVMSQVGHADSKMTMDVYAQLEQRAKREHGKSFDRLIRRARDLNGQPAPAPHGDEKVLKRYRDQKSPDWEPAESSKYSSKSASQQGKSEMARPGFEPGTPRFSVVCSTN